MPVIMHAKRSMKCDTIKIVGPAMAAAKNGLVQVRACSGSLFTPRCGAKAS